MKLFSLLFVAPLLFSIIEAVLYGQFISVKEAPYFVSMLAPVKTRLNVHDCGGSIISDYWIITAAHCTSLYHERVEDRIIAGESIPNKENIWTYDIEKIFVHGDYFETPMEEINDLALVKLKQPIVFNEYRQPIKIRQIPPRENDTVITMGFGYQGDTKGNALVLRQTAVTIVSNKICANYTKSFGMPKPYFCAGNGTTDACWGDSGGPATIDGELAGLVSFGPVCTNYKTSTRDPGVYTRVDLFFDWILRITGIVY